MLVQLDGSDHEWFEDRGPRCVLIVYIDDATSRILYAEFVDVDVEDTFTLLRTTRSYLRRYGRPGAEAGWHFLTGDPEALARLTSAVGFRYQWDEEIRQFAHPSGLVVLTPEGRITRYLYGIEYAPKDLRLSLVEASERKIGTPIDQAMLFCYQYNPTTGRYGLLTMRLIRGGAVLTVLGLGGLIFTLRRKEQAMLRDAAR